MAKGNLWRGLATLMAALLAISIGLSSMAEARAAFLNTRLGTTNYIMVTNDDGESGDGIYFDSEFTSLAQLIAAEAEVAEQLASEGVVLLKNNGALPLNKGSETVTLWGMNSNIPVLGGLVGSGASTNEGQPSYDIKGALAEKGFTVNQTMADFYSFGNSALDPYRMVSNFFGAQVPGHSLVPTFWTINEPAANYLVGEAPASVYTNDVLSSADGTAAIVVISRDSTEAADYFPEMTSPEGSNDSYERPLALSTNERAVIGLAKAHSSKVIVMINANNPMEINELKQDADIDAIIWVGEPGVYGMLGVADVLSGDVNPSGSLPDTYATVGTSAPSMVNYGIYLFANGTGMDARGDWYLVESEGIYTGYKYYETRYEDQILGQGSATASAGASSGSAWSYANEMTYPFGYGLSYTTFEMKLDSVEVNVGGTGTAKVTVKNTGSVAGKTAVQLYVQAPYTAGGIEKSAVQLLDFTKTGVIAAGGSEQVTIEFDPQYMASYDDSAVKANGTTGAWVLDAGDYYFAVGNGAHNALNNILASKRGSTDGLVTITDDEVISADCAAVWNLGTKDIETYSVGVENALQDADLNKLIPGAVEYTTRADWTKGWTPVTNLTATEEMLVSLRNEDNPLTANGGVVTWGANNGLKLVDFILTDDNGNFAGVVDINDPQWDLLMDQVTLDEAINFLAYAGDDIENIDSIGLPRSYANDGPVGFVPDQVADYAIRWSKANSSEPTYVDGSGEYDHYAMSVFPTEPIVAATFNKELVEREGELMGEQGLWSNESSIFGPGLNLHRSPYCARNHEYYSEDSMLTNLLGVAVCKGGKSKGLMMEPKHYAFNHMEINRFGVATYFNEQSGRENELRGFQGAMSGNYAQGIMTCFNRVGSMFGGGHPGTHIQIARNEWGYTGWFVTDMINGADYMNWRVVVANGGAGLLTSAAYEGSEIGKMEDSKSAIAADEAFQLNMKQAIKYYAYTMAGSNAMNGITSNTRMVYVRTWWQNAILGAEIGFAVLTVAFVALGVVNSMKKKKTN